MLVLAELRLSQIFRRGIRHRSVDLVRELVLLKLKRHFLILKGSDFGSNLIELIVPNFERIRGRQRLGLRKLFRRCWRSVFRIGRFCLTRLRVRRFGIG